MLTISPNLDIISKKGYCIRNRIKCYYSVEPRVWYHSMQNMTIVLVPKTKCEYEYEPRPAGLSYATTNRELRSKMSEIVLRSEVSQPR